MKPKHREWLKLTGTIAPTTVPAVRRTIVMRHLPLVLELENQLILRSDSRGRTVPGIEDRYIERLFGVQRGDTFRWYPDDFDDLPANEQNRIDAEIDAYEEQFETGSDLTDDETVEVLLKVGLDFRDERGHPLRCTKFLARQAEAAARGLCGRLPDVEQAEADRFGSKLAAEAEAFMKGKQK